jgi:bombesin receptor subtype-3
VILICVPLHGLIYVYDSWPWDGELGEILCRGSEYAKDISIGVSIFTIVALATDRYQGIVNPLKKLQARSKLVLFIILFTWLLAILVATPTVVLSKVVFLESGLKFCSPYGKYFKHISTIGK